MNIKKTKFEGVEEITPIIHEDKRGHLFDFPNASKFIHNVCSFSKRNTLRGLHYQLHNGIWQEKIVRCLSGKIFDVVVDIKSGQYYSTYLSSRNYTSITVPGGYAHGFFALEDSQVLYQMSDTYRPESQHTIAWDDPDLDIRWPLNDLYLLMSDKDLEGKAFKDILTE